jgi:hypothetical protein
MVWITWQLRGLGDDAAIEDVGKADIFRRLADGSCKNRSGRLGYR